jgi:hypothetical protein
MKALDSKYKELILWVMGAHQLVLNCMLSADSQEGSYTTWNVIYCSQSDFRHLGINFVHRLK